MSETLVRIRNLVNAGDVLMSAHAQEKVDKEGVYPPDILAGVATATVVEDYPDHGRGPCVLVLQADAGGRPIHCVWAIPVGQGRPAVLVTVYRPDPARWSPDFTKRVR